MNDSAPLDSPGGLAAVREIIREEVGRLGAGGTITQTPPFDANALREIVSGEVRAGINAAGCERWSAEPLSKMIDEFLVDEEKRKSVANIARMSHGGWEHSYHSLSRTNRFAMCLGRILKTIETYSISFRLMTVCECFQAGVWKSGENPSMARRYSKL